MAISDRVNPNSTVGKIFAKINQQQQQQSSSSGGGGGDSSSKQETEPISGKPLDKVKYDEWSYGYEETPIDDRHVMRTDYRARDVYILDNGKWRFSYTQRERLNSYETLSVTARKEAVERYEYRSAQQAVENYGLAAQTDDLALKSVYTRTGEMYANIGRDYLVSGEQAGTGGVPVYSSSYLMDKRKYVNQGIIPQSFRDSINIPSDITDAALRNRYIKESYEVYLGIKSSDEAERDFNSFYQDQMNQQLSTQHMSAEDKKREQELEEIRKRWSGEAGPIGWLQEGVRYTSASLLRPDILFKSIGEIIDVDSWRLNPFETPVPRSKESKERLLSDYYEGLIPLETARKKGGDYGVLSDIFNVGVESYKPGGFGFIGTLSAGFVGLGGGLGALTGTGGSILQTGVPLALGGGMSAIVGADIGYKKALEDAGLAPPKTTQKEITNILGQVGLAAGFGYAATRPTTLPRSKIAVTEYPGGVYSGQRYYEVLGRPIKYGREIFITEPIIPKYYSQPNIGTSTSNIISYKPPTRYGPTEPAILSMSQIKGNQKIIYDNLTKQFTTERIYKTGYKPIGVKFKPPKNQPKTMEQIFTKIKPIDLTKKMNMTTIQKNITDFTKGSFYIEPKGILELEKTKNISEGKKILWKPKTIEDIINPKQLNKIRFDTTKYKQMKIWEEPKKPMKPFTTQFKPPINRPKTIEEIYNKKALENKELFLNRKNLTLKTKQTTLDKLYSFDAKKILNIIRTPPKPTPLKFPKVTKDIEKTIGLNKTILKQPTAKGQTTAKSGAFTKEYDPYAKIMNQGYRNIRFTEETSYISDYWKGIQPSMPKTESIITPVYDAKKIDKIINAHDIKKDLAGQLGNITIQTDLQRQMQDQIRNTMQKQGTGIMTAQMEMQDSIQDLLQQQMQQQTQFLRQDQILEQIQIPRQETRQERSKAEEPNVFMFETFFSKDKAQMLVNPVYDVEVKQRMYVNGKKVYPESFKKMNKKPLTLYDAHDLGAYYIDNTAKATYRLVPAEGRPGRLPRHIPPRQAWETYQRDDRFIEYPTYRIDSPGELREITYQAHKSRRNMNKNIRRNIRKTFRR